MRKALVALAMSVLACGTYNTPPSPSVGQESPFPAATVNPVGTALVAPGNWNCRTTRNGSVIAYASGGQLVEVLDRLDGWVRVSLAGRECWLIEDAIQ